MYELIACIICSVALVYHATCILLNRNELRRLIALIDSQNPTQIEKKELWRPKKRATRFTDRSKKWLETKGNQRKEEG